MIKPIADEFPDEFQKPNIIAFTQAFDRQIAEVIAALNGITVVALDDATGVMLDNIGSKVGLTRLQATARVPSPDSYPVGDDDYRKLLKQQIIKNSSNCSFDDALKCVLEWNDAGTLATTISAYASLTATGGVSRDMLAVPGGVTVITS